MSAGLLGVFPAAITTGFQNIGGSQKLRGTPGGWPALYPAGLTRSYVTLGAVEKQEANNWVDTFSDAVTASDGMSVVQGVNATISDGVTAADSLAVAFAAHATFTDAVTAADSFTALLTASMTITDNVTAADSYTGTLAASLTISDAIATSDAMIGGIGYTDTFSDSITASDSFTNTAGYSFTFSDAVTASDGITGGTGYTNTFSDSVTASDTFIILVSPAPNIILSGTIDFVNPYCAQNQTRTFLNFGAIIGDDNFIRVNTANLLTGQALQPVTASIYFYAPGTNTNPVITKTGTCSTGYFLFPLAKEDIAPLAPGLYPWIAVITLPDASTHVVNLGDTKLTTGVMMLVNRPF